MIKVGTATGAEHPLLISSFWDEKRENINGIEVDLEQPQAHDIDLR
jgi:hypothetical protein